MTDDQQIFTAMIVKCQAEVMALLQLLDSLHPSPVPELGGLSVRQAFLAMARDWKATALTAMESRWPADAAQLQSAMDEIEGSADWPESWRQGPTEKNGGA